MTFKTAAELSIKQWEFDHLFALMNYLRTKPEVHVTKGTEDWVAGNHTVREARLAFDMGVSLAKLDPSIKQRTHCGSVGCLGGHIYLMQEGYDVLAGDLVTVTSSDMRSAHDYTNYGKSSALHDLFYPAPIDKWSDATPEATADAIENFLTKGDANWRGVAIKHQIRRA